MKSLLKYLNSLPMDERDDFCARCRTTQGYLRKAASIGQTLNAETCTALERESSGAVTRRDLRPDDWHLIWPELTSQQASI